MGNEVERQEFSYGYFFPSLIEFCFYFFKKNIYLFFTSDLYMKSWFKKKTKKVVLPGKEELIQSLTPCVCWWYLICSEHPILGLPDSELSG